MVDIDKNYTITAKVLPEGCFACPFWVNVRGDITKKGGVNKLSGYCFFTAEFKNGIPLYQRLASCPIKEERI